MCPGDIGMVLPACPDEGKSSVLPYSSWPRGFSSGRSDQNRSWWKGTLPKNKSVRWMGAGCVNAAHLPCTLSSLCGREKGQRLTLVPSRRSHGEALAPAFSIVDEPCAHPHSDHNRCLSDGPLGKSACPRIATNLQWECKRSSKWRQTDGGFAFKRHSAC